MKFKLGHTTITNKVAIAMREGNFMLEVHHAFDKYMVCDWGDTCEEDSLMNNEAVKNGDRIMALYKTSRGNIFIITEYDRSATTILFANEY